MKLIVGHWFNWDDIDKLPDAWLFDNYFHVAYDGDGNSEAQVNFERAIGIYSTYRGWDGWNDGSIVWADIREYARGEDLKSEFENVVFVCGHTQLADEPVIKEWVMDLDCRKPFVLDTETGEVKEYVTD